MCPSNLEARLSQGIAKAEEQLGWKLGVSHGTSQIPSLEPTDRLRIQWHAHERKMCNHWSSHPSPNRQRIAGLETLPSRAWLQ